MEEIERILLNEKIINTEQWQDAKDKQIGAKRAVHELLIEMGYITEERLLSVLSGHVDQKPLVIKEEEVDARALNLLSYLEMVFFAAFPFNIKDEVVQVAMSNPLDYKTITLLRERIKIPVAVHLVTCSHLREWLDKLDINDDMVYRLISFKRDEVSYDLKLPSHLPQLVTYVTGLGSPTVMIIDRIISDAIERRVEDIKFVFSGRGITVSFSTGGEWSDMLALDSRHKKKIMDRLKLIVGWETDKDVKEGVGHASLCYQGKHYRLSLYFDSSKGLDHVTVSLISSEVAANVIKNIAANAGSSPQTPYSLKVKVLLIDDSEVTLHLINGYLKDDAYEVHKAYDGKQGVEKALEIKPELIVMDADMPVMSGFDAIIQLRKDVRVSSIPIVMLTARTDQESELKGLDCGADDYLVKPVSKEKFLARIKLLLKKRRG